MNISPFELNFSATNLPIARRIGASARLGRWPNSGASRRRLPRSPVPILSVVTDRGGIRILAAAGLAAGGFGKFTRESWSPSRCVVPARREVRHGAAPRADGTRAGHRARCATAIAKRFCSILVLACCRSTRAFVFPIRRLSPSFELSLAEMCSKRAIRRCVSSCRQARIVCLSAGLGGSKCSSRFRLPTAAARRVRTPTSCRNCCSTAHPCGDGANSGRVGTLRASLSCAPGERCVGRALAVRRRRAMLRFRQCFTGSATGIPLISSTR